MYVSGRTVHTDTQQIKPYDLLEGWGFHHFCDAVMHCSVFYQ